jgi:hypothetical protein
MLRAGSFGIGPIVTGLPFWTDLSVELELDDLILVDAARAEEYAKGSTRMCATVDAISPASKPERVTQVGAV